MSNALLKSNITKSVCCLESKFCIISCIVKISWLSHECLLSFRLIPKKLMSSYTGMAGNTGMECP